MLQHTADGQTTVNDLNWSGKEFTCGAVRRELVAGLRAESKFETFRTGK